MFQSSATVALSFAQHVADLGAAAHAVELVANSHGCHSRTSDGSVYTMEIRGTPAALGAFLAAVTQAAHEAGAADAVVLFQQAQRGVRDD